MALLKPTYLDSVQELTVSAVQCSEECKDLYPGEIINSFTNTGQASAVHLHLTDQEQDSEHSRSYTTHQSQVKQFMLCLSALFLPTPAPSLCSYMNTKHSHYMAPSVLKLRS